MDKLVENQRATLLARIEGTRGDVEHLISELATRGIKVPALPPKPAARRPKTLQTLEAELRAISALRAWLHGRLIKARGEKVFEGPLEKLAAAGIVSAPAQPTQRARGRPRGTPTADALEFWSRWVEAQYQLAGRERHHVDSIALNIVNAQKGTRSTDRSSVHRARRRGRKSPP